MTNPKSTQTDERYDPVCPDWCTAEDHGDTLDPRENWYVHTSPRGGPRAARIVSVQSSEGFDEPTRIQLNCDDDLRAVMTADEADQLSEQLADLARRMRGAVRS
jgi:hypothetical protein